MVFSWAEKERVILYTGKRRMKKIFLSALVIGLFIIYGLAKRESATTAQIPLQQLPTALTTPSAAPATTAAATPTPGQAAANPPATQGQYKNGTYTGSTADAYYGNVQVQVTISGGRITAVNFLQYPSDRSTSVYINSQAMPYLQQEAIAAQSAQVNVVSGATYTSQAFQQSLASALAQAQ